MKPLDVSPEAVAHIAKALPPFPGVILELLDCLRDESSSIEHLVHVARNDGVITAGILSQANHLRRMRAQSDLTDPFVAASIIGLNRVRSVVVSLGMNRFLEDAPGGSFLFRHSLAVAIAGHELAMLTGVSPEESYIAGILHDVGQLCFQVVNAEAFSAAYQRSSVDGRLTAHEKVAFGLDHCEMGARVAELWNLPVSIQAAIASHHDGTAVINPVQAVISLAETLVRGLDLPASEKNRVTHLNSAAMEALELRWDDPQVHDCFCRCWARFHYAMRHYTH